MIAEPSPAVPIPDEPRSTAFGTKLPTALATVVPSIRGRIGKLGDLGELGYLVLWTWIVTAPYLNLDASLVPTGREYLSVITGHHFWLRLRECLGCALWDGSMQGGTPALADPFGSTFHPLIGLPTLLLGVSNGAKIALAGAFLLAGLAQWWLAFELGLGKLARVWSGLMAIGGGYLAVRMDLGAFGWVVSAAAFALVLPALLRCCRDPSHKNVVILGCALASLALAGQGYLQLGLVLMSPAVLLLVVLTGRRQALAGLVLAGVLALMLAAPLLVPFAHFSPNAAKDIDVNMQLGQPLAYVPLNLVIGDARFYLTDALNKQAWPSVYANHVGWLAVLLAFFGLSSMADRRLAPFLAAWVVLGLSLASAELLPTLVRISPIPWVTEQLLRIRIYPYLATMAIPALLALAAVGADRLWHSRWPRGRLVSETGRGGITLDTRWVIPLVLALALLETYTFARQWISVSRPAPEINEVLQALRTTSTQWVDTPFGEHFWIEPAIAEDMKLSQGFLRWRWRDRSIPEPALLASRVATLPGHELLRSVGSLNLFRPTITREYAQLTGPGGETSPCPAHSRGGDIDLTCTSSSGGTLLVQENQWDGWHAYVDGQPTSLKTGQRLSIDLSPGPHQVSFRYRPWDVWVGLALAFIGAAAALALWSGFESAPGTS
jgi:hypothetical protein